MVDLADIQKECLESLYDCAENVMKHLNPNERDEQLKILQSIVKEYCILDHQRQMSQEALDKCKVGLNQSNIEKLDTNFGKALKSCVSKQPKPHQHPSFARFQNIVLHTQTPQREDAFDTSDVIETVASEQYIDPITQKQIVSPVRNKFCNHVYEKSILNIIKGKPNMKCPIVGCTNRQLLKRGDLIYDDALKLKLSQMHREERDPLEDSN